MNLVTLKIQLPIRRFFVLVHVLRMLFRKWIEHKKQYAILEIIQGIGAGGGENFREA